MAQGGKVGVYCSDVSGAFDRVSRQRMIAKLEAKGMEPSLVKVFASWLRSQKAKVLVGGQASEHFSLTDMIFQGTVWGPTLWNIFYEDARRAINEVFFKEVIYADDLNAYRFSQQQTWLMLGSSNARSVAKQSCMHGARLTRLVSILAKKVFMYCLRLRAQARTLNF